MTESYPEKYRPLAALVRELMGRHRRPVTRDDVRSRLGITDQEARMTLCLLLQDNRITPVGHRDGAPAYAPLDVAACEWCGLVSHAAVYGECPACRERVARCMNGMEVGL